MTKYEVIYTKRYKKAVKKLDDRVLQELKAVEKRLANGEILDAKHKDHKLKGSKQHLRECHIRPNLCLIYRQVDDVLILVLVDVGSHSDLGLTS